MHDIYQTLQKKGSDPVSMSLDLTSSFYINSIFPKV